ncbi:kinase-like domain-containing protein, partial [Hyaloraphidium curvatum]
QFRTVRRLGTGTQATVRLALYTPTGQAFAVKAFRRPKRPLSASAATLKTAGPESGVTAELLVRRRLQLAGPHPCQEHIHFVTEEKAYLVFELCAGMDLQHCMQARGGCFPEDEARPIIATVLRTLTYLHGIGIVHRDVKPANILVRDPNRIAETLCLADFGGAFVADPALGSSPILQPTAPRDHPLTMHTITGTPYFLPPELVMGLPYGPKVDCWALGCTAHAVLVGETPFASAANLAELYGMIQAGELHLPGSVSDEARGFLSMLLQPDPAARASAAAALGHPWLA